MKIIQITPGSGDNFYCENCLRDAVMVEAWRRQGHDGLVVPLYLPVPTGQAEGGDSAKIFMGGINVYLQQKLALFRWTPGWIDRLFDHPWLLGWAARRAGMTRAKDLADTMLSMLRGEEGRQVKELERLVDWLAGEAGCDVVCLSNALLVGLARRIKQRLGVPVACLLQDEDEFLDGLPEPQSRQAWQILRQRAAEIDVFIAVSRYYARVMQQRLGLEEERIKVAHIGIRTADFNPAREGPESPTIGFLSRMCPEKGLDTLIEAFIKIRSDQRLQHVKLRIAGGQMTSDKPFIAGIRARLSSLGLTDDVEFLAGFNHASRYDFLRNLTVLSVPERRGPAGGTYVLEALAGGVPVVQPPVGVFCELQQAIGEGVILAESNDAKALAAALERLLLEPSYARELGRRGREAVLKKFDIDKTSRELISIFQKTVERPHGE